MSARFFETRYVEEGRNLRSRLDKGQKLENQLAELSAACARNDCQVVRVFTDCGISGAKGRGARKGLEDLLKAVVRREVDQVCVWSIDRLGRSLRDLINVLDELRQKGMPKPRHVTTNVFRSFRSN